MDDPVELALALAIKFEGLYLSPYLDPVGIPTIAAGCTYYLDGRRVLLTDPPITKEEAINLTRELIKRRYMRAALTLCPGLDLNPRIAAITDFVLNLGAGRLKGSTLRKRINEGRWREVPTELLKWVYGGSKVLPGLKLRRAAEAAMVMS